MLIIGAPNAIIPIVNMNDFIVYNISSNIVRNDIPKLNFMDLQGLDYSRVDVDIQFYNIIFSNNTYFSNLMAIMLPLYQGRNVALLVYREENFFDPFTETIGKIIQQRYGYNYQLLNDASDYDPYDDSSFNINGVFYLDQDIKRYNDIIIKNNPGIFINENISDSHF